MILLAVPCAVASVVIVGARAVWFTMVVGWETLRAEVRR